MLPEEIQLPNSDLVFSPKNTVVRGGLMYVNTRTKFLKGHLNHFSYGAFNGLFVLKFCFC